jgi:hypothetical protein
VVVLFLPEGIMGSLERLFRRKPKAPTSARPQTAMEGAQ